MAFKPTSKTFSYLGYEFNIPSWANYIAADKTGRVFVYECEPYIKRMYPLGYTYKYNTKCEQVGRLPCGRVFVNTIKEIK